MFSLMVGASNKSYHFVNIGVLYSIMNKEPIFFRRLNMDIKEGYVYHILVLLYKSLS